MPSKTRSYRALRIAVVVVACAVVGLGVVYYYRNDPSDPTSGAFFPKCIFRLLTGFECPGCGSQRALHSLLHLDIAAAWGYNPFLIIMLPAIAILSAAFLLRERYPSFNNAVNHPAVSKTILIMTIVWWVGRNLL